MEKRYNHLTLEKRHLIKLMLPENALKSITFDNGLECYDHRFLKEKFGNRHLFLRLLQPLMARISRIPRRSLHYLSPMEYFLLFSSGSLKLFNFNSAYVALRV